VVAVIDGLAKRYNIQEIAVDRWNINQISKDLETLGKNNGRPDWLVGFGQGFAAMTAPSKELEVLVLSEKIAHDGNPVLRWMFSNVQVERDNAGNIKCHKGKAVEKIDGIVATIMALGRAQVSSLHATNIYDTQGITLL
jgi:phage terminase large subunit-like protein